MSEGEITVHGTLQGELAIQATLSGVISNQASLVGILQPATGYFPQVYDGDYEVTPRLYAQSLDTDGKLMEDDVTVYEIPIARTTNPTGGLTVLIG